MSRHAVQVGEQSLFASNTLQINALYYPNCFTARDWHRKYDNAVSQFRRGGRGVTVNLTNTRKTKRSEANLSVARGTQRALGNRTKSTGHHKHVANSKKPTTNTMYP